MAFTLNKDLDYKRGELLRLWPEDVVVNPAKRGRKFPPTPEQVRARMLDMDARGQLQPCPCTITHDRHVELSAGFTRWEALSLWNTENPETRKRIELIIKDGNEETALLNNIAENRERNLTTVVDDAHNIQRLSEQFHKTDEEICAIYKSTDGVPMSPATLENMRKIVRLSEEHQRQIHDGHLSASIGYMLADMAPEARTEVLDDAKEDGGKLTVTKVLKSARKKKALKGTPHLKAPEIRTTWAYLAEPENEKNPRVVKLAKMILEWHTGVLPEPDFLGKLRRMLKD